MRMNEPFWVFVFVLFLSFGQSEGYSCDTIGFKNALTAGGDISLDCTVATTITLTEVINVPISFNFDGQNLVTIDMNEQRFLEWTNRGSFKNMKFARGRMVVNYPTTFSHVEFFNNTCLFTLEVYAGLTLNQCVFHDIGPEQMSTILTYASITLKSSTFYGSGRAYQNAIEFMDFAVCNIYYCSFSNYGSNINNYGRETLQITAVGSIFDSGVLESYVSGSYNIFKNSTDMRFIDDQTARDTCQFDPTNTLFGTFGVQPGAQHPSLPLTACSPGINAGTTVAQTPQFDQNGVAIPNGPHDIGAVQFGGNTCVSISDAVGLEGNSMEFTMTFSGKSTKDIGVNMITMNGTAIAGTHFNAVRNTSAVYPFPQSLTQTVVVSTIDDDIYHANLTMIMTLVARSNVVVVDGQGTGIIMDNDPLPSVVSMKSTTLSVAEDSANIYVEFTIIPSSTQQISIPFTLVFNSGDSGSYIQGPVVSPVTISAGTTSSSIVIPIWDNSLDNDDRLFNVTLSAPTGNTVLGTNTTTTVTIVDDEPTSKISLESRTYTIAENKTSVELSFTVEPISSKDIFLEYSLTDGTAVNGLDYRNSTLTPSPIRVNIQTSLASIVIPIINDIINEDNEWFTVTLTNATNAVLGTNSSATVTIIDDEPTPVISLISTTFSVMENASYVLVNFTITPASSKSISVPVTRVLGTASNADVGNPTVNPVIVSPGSTMTSIFIPLSDDQLSEGDEQFNITLGTPTNSVLGTNITAVVTILDNEPTPVISLISQSISIMENAPYVLVNFTITPASSKSISVPVTQVFGTASSADVGSPSVNPVIVNPGSPLASIFIPLLDDQLSEGDEQFNITLGTPTNAVLGTNTTAVVTILDNEALSAISWTSRTVSVAETAGNVTLFFSITPASSKTISLGFSTVDGTAVRGQDYSNSATSSPLSIPPSTSSFSIVFPINDDIIYEGNEQFNVTFSASPTNSVLGTNTSIAVTILDNEPTPVISLTSRTVSVAENAGNVNLFFSVTPASSQSISVPVTRTFDSATSDDVGSPVTNPVVVSAGTTSSSIVIPILDDIIDEYDEQFNVTLGTPINAVLGTNITTVVTIVDNDPVPNVSFSNSTITTSENSGTILVRVVLNNPSAKAVVVDFSVSGTATEDDDYIINTASPLLFAPGTTSQEISLTILKDGDSESLETVIFTLTSNSSSVVSPSVCTVSIADSSQLPTVSIHPYDNMLISVMEGDRVNVTIELDFVSIGKVTVPFNVVPGTALNNTDYSVITKSPLIFNPGTTAMDVEIQIVDDSLGELAETLQLVLGTPTNALLGSNSPVTIRIENDDFPSVEFTPPPGQSSFNESSTIVITVDMDTPCTFDVPVMYDVIGDPSLYETTTTSNKRDVQTNFSMIIPAGSQRGEISVRLKENNIRQTDPHIIINVLSVNGISSNSPPLRISIAEDDPIPTVFFVESQVDLYQNTADGLPLQIKLTNPTDSSVETQVSISESSTAVLGTDYTLSTQNINFPKLDTEQFITITPLATNSDRDDLSVTLSFENSTNAQTSAQSITVRIRNSAKKASKKTIGGGAIAGIVIGVIAGVLVLGAVAGLAYRKKKQNDTLSMNSEDEEIARQLSVELNTPRVRSMANIPVVATAAPETTTTTKRATDDDESDEEEVEESESSEEEESEEEVSKSESDESESESESSEEESESE